MEKLRHIDKIGIELEGEFHIEDMTATVYGDGSVNLVECYDTEDCMVGETCSLPLETWCQVQDFLERNFPVGVDESCGTHVHLSTKSIAAYETLSTLGYYKALKTFLVDYAESYSVPSEFLERLQGGNTYCQDDFHPELQMYDTGKSDYRYRIVNYCYALHGTMEIRVLPAFYKWTDLYHVLVELTEFTDNYIDLHIEDDVLELPSEPTYVTCMSNEFTRERI